MIGIGEQVIQAISQISCEFTCDIGNPKVSVVGTGFFIKKDNDLLFVTNRHNVDPTLKLGNGTTYRLSKISLCLRRRKAGDDISTEVRWFDLKNIDDITHSHCADVSIIYKFDVDNYEIIDQYQPDCFLISELADDAYIKKIAMMDAASFIGFSGNGKNKWWDMDGNFPISRTINIASFPGKPYKNESIITDDVVLVSGLSFSGSSGSPVFLHQKGIQINSGCNIEIKNDSYVPPKIIGIMSGHWWDKNFVPNMFTHSGLSYYTRSTAIHDLVKRI